MSAPQRVIPKIKRGYGLEACLLGLLGLACIWQQHLAHSLGIIGETIIIVIALSILMGVTNIPFPTGIKFSRYPLVAGLASGFMDSFLVLLLLGKAELEGSEEDKFKFKTYNMIAALIGGIITYFGEVYMLPLALMYGLREWWSMLPIVPPVLAFLLILSWLNGRLDVRVKKVETGSDNVHWWQYAVFAGFILLLLIFKNPLLILGLLLLYAFVIGEGEEAVEIIKTKTEMAVMMLLFVALLVAKPIEPLMDHFTGWLAIIPTSINGVLTGAIYPASGDFWMEAVILSTGVLLTPLSSLVGVMLFKKMSEWKKYMKLSIPLMLIWFLLSTGWVFGIWKPFLEDSFYQVFGERPSLVQEQNSPH